MHPTRVSSANQFIFRAVNLNFYEVIEGIMKERDEDE